MPETNPSITNALIHLGRGPNHSGRSVNLPIHMGSTMLFETLSEFESARDARYQPDTLYYGRYGNASTFELEKIVTALEGGFGCTALSSGVAAVTLSLMGSSKAGDHVLVADNVYGNTRGFCDKALTRFGVEVEYFDPMIGADLEGLMRPNTSVVMFEAPGSGTFEVPDIPTIAKVARDGGAVSILDGTWATPVFCQPLSLGVDMVVHSGSKYIGGHADSMMGFIVCNEATFQPTRQMAMTFGDRPGAMDVFLSLRGLRTLDMRMRHAEAAGMKVANWLSEQPQVLRMLHPAFTDCPGHEFWKRDFSGAAGLFSAVIKPCSDEQLHKFIDALSMFGIGASWGGYESIVLPFKPPHTAKLWTDEGHVVRFSIGNESTDDLIENIALALPKLG